MVIYFFLNKPYMFLFFKDFNCSSSTALDGEEHSNASNCFLSTSKSLGLSFYGEKFKFIILLIPRFFIYSFFLYEWTGCYGDYIFFGILISIKSLLLIRSSSFDSCSLILITSRFRFKFIFYSSRYLYFWFWVYNIFFSYSIYLSILILCYFSIFYWAEILASSSSWILNFLYLSPLLEIKREFMLLCEKLLILLAPLLL